MFTKLKSLTFRIFSRTCHIIGGTGIGKIPGISRFYDFIFNRLWLNKDTIEVQGSQLYVNSSGLPKSYKKAFRDYIMLDWEKRTTEKFKEVVKGGDVVLDLGANMGFFTLLAAKIVGTKGRVYAFEPNPTNYNLLIKNIELNGYDNVLATQKAVSNKSGKVKLYLCEDDIGNSTIYEYGEERQTIEIETVALDSFFKGKENHIDVIKMDVEGAEMAAFLGMDQIIRENKDIKIFCELYPVLMKAMGYSPEEFVGKLLHDYHFTVAPIDYLPIGSKEHSAISEVSEIMQLFKKVEVLNLFLARKKE